MSNNFNSKKSSDSRKTSGSKSNNSRRSYGSRDGSRSNDSGRSSGGFRGRNSESSSDSRRSYGSRDGSRGNDSRRSSGSRSFGGSSRRGSFGGSRVNNGGRSGGGFGGGKRRVAPKFDPSMFIKKVEETTVAEVYTPKNTFADFKINEQLKTNIAAKGYLNPMPIQDQAIPYLLDEKDVIATANTGTGKTAAFLIPLIENILSKKSHHALIIAPTRELAAQIHDEFKSFAVKTGLKSALCIGGASIRMQTKVLRAKPQFVIGTPGRLIDLERNRVIRLDRYSSIVLDEVDRILDMGFIKDIKHIISKLPVDRHSLFFSATMPKEVQNIMNSFLQDPVSVSVKTRQSAENVNQDVIKVGGGNKIDIIHDLLVKPECKKSIMFLRTKRSVDKFARELSGRGFEVGLIHSNRTQAQRKRALESFKNGRVSVLLATDVVARGIDINDISHVINFDLPETYEDYIHRIGRTGRADKVGQAITLV